jgi:hypothetical protein
MSEKGFEIFQQWEAVAMFSGYSSLELYYEVRFKPTFTVAVQCV